MTECEICEKEFPTALKLKRHKANIHDIDVVWHVCGVDGCTTSCKDKYNLKKHKAHCHDIDVVLRNCDHCELSFKTTSDLKRHKASVHDIDVKWFQCQHCKERFKTKPNLTRHIRTIHNIGTIYFPCEYCERKFKAKASLKSHLTRIHNIGVTLYYCDVDNCTYSGKIKSDLTRHKQNIHNINVKWRYCHVCGKEFKNNDGLREHISYRHDIGDKVCDFCLGNRYKLNQYNDKGITSYICRTCLRKVTGRDTRVEITMSNYLDKHFGTEFLLCTDSQVQGDACQKYRPDKLYGSPGLVIQVECDEHQHYYSGNDYTCDEKRISDMYNEYPGNKYVIIRWNPDKYKTPKGVKKIKTQSDKLEL